MKLRLNLILIFIVFGVIAHAKKSTKVNSQGDCPPATLSTVKGCISAFKLATCPGDGEKIKLSTSQEEAMDSAIKLCMSEVSTFYGSDSDVAQSFVTVPTACDEEFDTPYTKKYCVLEAANEHLTAGSAPKEKVSRKEKYKDEGGSMEYNGNHHGHDEGEE